MKTLDSIPTHKIERATKLVSTGVKIGGNYLRYYGEKLIRGEEDKDKLNANNAKDIYDGLKELKGSALKVAQMLSMAPWVPVRLIKSRLLFSIQHRA